MNIAYRDYREEYLNEIAALVQQRLEELYTGNNMPPIFNEPEEPFIKILPRPFKTGMGKRNKLRLYSGSFLMETYG